MDWEARAAVFLRAAELLAGPWRDTLNAATMLNQSKTCFQAEIDAACELIDFWRFNAAYMREMYSEQPQSAPGIWDYVEYRALEGFVFAVTPFNFTSIAGNLPTAPALIGNTVLWKPASTSVLSGYYVMKLLQAAGLPDGVVNFLPGSGGEVGGPVLDRPELAGIHFTGSTEVFQGGGRRLAATSASTRATRGSSARPAARTSCSRIPRPTGRRWQRRWSAVRSSSRGRSARRRPAHTSRARCGTAG